MPTQDDPAPHASEVTKVNTIVVKVGAQGRTYTLHKKLLAHHSKYFENALSGRWKESDEGIIPLDDVDAEAFDAFVDWIYEKDLPSYIYTQQDDAAILPVLWRAYPLADRLLAQSFKVALFDAIFSKLGPQKQFPFFQTISFAYNNLRPYDPLLRLMVDAFCLNGGFKYRVAHDPAPFLSEVPQEAFVRLHLRMTEICKLAEEKKIKRDAYDI